MQQLKVSESDSGQTLIKYLDRYFKEATQSFLYKMIRKKNITLNGKKAQGNERLITNDLITVFMSDDTIEKFKGNCSKTNEYQNAYEHNKNLDIVYEDNNILLLNKPVGMLSQKSEASDSSANEVIIGYLCENEQYDLTHFVPSVCNRLDRNTGGILIFGKTLLGCNEMNQLLRDRTMSKYYKTIVVGKIDHEAQIQGYLEKDNKKNKVTIHNTNYNDEVEQIETRYIPIRYNPSLDVTELDVELITGKSHQIRAHLASIGHPIIGDSKYGNQTINLNLKKRYGLRNQLLYSYKLHFPELRQELSAISNQTFEIVLPAIFDQIMTGDNKCLRGIQED